MSGMTETVSITRSGDANFDFVAIHDEVAALLAKQIFFVGGVEKSGTSWFQQLLDRHPEISCDGESHFPDVLYPALKNAVEEYNRQILAPERNPLRNELDQPHPGLDSPTLDYLYATAILCSLRKQIIDDHVRAVGERTPKNAHVFDRIARLFRSARFIHIVRDPRDVGVSCWFHARRAQPAEMRPHMTPVTYFAREYAGIWNEVVGRGIRFGASHPTQYCELRYEDLLAEPILTFARICRFLGVDDSEPTVRRCLEEASFEKLSRGRSRGQQNTESDRKSTRLNSS